MASSTSRATFGPPDYPLLTTALENYAEQQRYFAGLLDPDDGQLDHARRILYQQAQDADDLSKRLDAAFTVPSFEPADASCPSSPMDCFGPGQLAFFQIAEFIGSYETDIELPGYHVKLRDGVPILAPGDGHSTNCLPTVGQRRLRSQPPPQLPSRGSWWWLCAASRPISTRFEPVEVTGRQPLVRSRCTF